MDFRELLKQYSIVIVRDDEIVFKSMDSGIAPLLEAVESIGIKSLHDTCVADRVIGKAAALLVALFKPRYVFSIIMSKSAINVLEENNIEFDYDNLVDYILNREKNDLCPFEKSVLRINDPWEGYRVIKDTLEKLRESHK